MRDFLKMMRQYASPYKGHLVGSVLLNMFSAVFNIFSFAVVVPLLDILFKVNEAVYQFIPWDTPMDFKERRSTTCTITYLPLPPRTEPPMRCSCWRAS